MACTYFINIEGREAAKARTAVEQPRAAVNQLSRRALPHAEPRRQPQSLLLEKLPLELRLSVWEHVLQREYTTLERWRLPYNDASIIYLNAMAELDADCFPYRLRTAKTESDVEKQEKPIALLLACRQM
jgi:hypothetical protein